MGVTKYQMCIVVGKQLVFSGPKSLYLADLKV